MELFASLDHEKIDELGSQDYLGLPQSEIDKIQENFQNPTRRKEAYLDLYVHQHPCPTWSPIARILRWVQLPQQADLVDSTYVNGTQDTLLSIYYHACYIRNLSHVYCSMYPPYQYCVV